MPCTQVNVETGPKVTINDHSMTTRTTMTPLEGGVIRRERAGRPSVHLLAVVSGQARTDRSISGLPARGYPLRLAVVLEFGWFREGLPDEPCLLPCSDNNKT